MPPANAVTDAITWFALALTGVSSTTDKITLAFSGSGLTVGNIAFGNGTDTALNCYTRTSSSAFPQRIAASAPYAINTRYFVAGSRTTAQSYPDMYLDGVLSNGTGYSPGAGNLAASVTNVSMNNGSAALTGVTYCGGLFNRTLSAYEHLLLARNPWQIFERADRPIFYSLPSIGVGVTVDVPAAGIAIAASAPMVSGGASIAPPAAGIAISGFAPKVSGGASVKPPAVTVTVSAHAPAVSVGASVAVPAATITIQAYSPTVGGGVTVSVPSAAVTVTPNAPAVSAGKSIAVPAAAITVTPHAPGVSAGKRVDVPVASVTVQAHAPSVSASSGISVPVATIAVQAHAPAVSTGASVAVPASVVSILAHSPAIVTAGGRTLTDQDRADIEAIVLEQLTSAPVLAAIAAAVMGEINAGSILTSTEQTRLLELHRIHGLEAGVDLVVTETSRTAGAIAQGIDTSGGTTTVSRS